MNKYIISLVLVGVLSVGYLVLAEEDTSKPSPSVSPKPSLRVKAQEQKDVLRQNVEDVKTNLKAEAEDAREKLKKAAEAMKEDLQKRKEEFNNAIKVKRIELEDENFHDFQGWCY